MEEGWKIAGWGLGCLVAAGNVREKASGDGRRPDRLEAQVCSSPAAVFLRVFYYLLRPQFIHLPMGPPESPLWERVELRPHVEEPLEFCVECWAI